MNNVSSRAAAGRLLREYKTAQKDKNEHVSIAPVTESDLFHWVGYIRGAEGTSYEGIYYHYTLF